MAQTTLTVNALSNAAEPISYQRFAGTCAILAGVVSIFYAIAFIFLKNPTLYGMSQLVGGLLATAALIGLYSRLREIEPSFALWGVVLSLAGSIGSTIHGGYDLANAINPPDLNLSNFPSGIDPRGLVTFGIAGVGTFALSWLMLQAKRFPSGLGYLGYLLAVLLVVLYLGRLIILNPTDPLIAYPALISGFIVNPLWYVWLGVKLRSA